MQSNPPVADILQQASPQKDVFQGQTQEILQTTSLQPPFNLPKAEAQEPSLANPLEITHLGSD